MNYILRDLLHTAREARLGPSAQKIIDEATVYLAHFRRNDPVPNPDSPDAGDLIGDESGEIETGEFDTSDSPVEDTDPGQPIEVDAGDLEETTEATNDQPTDDTVASTPAAIVNETAAQRRKRLKLEREAQS